MNIKQFLKQNAAMLVSMLLIAGTFVIQFSILTLDDEIYFDKIFPQLVVNMFLLVGMSVTWLNAGMDEARTHDSIYRENASEYAKLISQVTKNRELNRLEVYCRVRTAEIHEDKITSVLSGVAVDREKYESELKMKNSRQLKSAGYTYRQRRVIARVRAGKVKVKPILSTQLVSSGPVYDECSVSYNEQAAKARATIMRCLRAIITATIIAFIGKGPATDITNMAEWALFAIRLCTTVYAGFSSHHEGYVQIAQVKNDVILRRIAFVNKFQEWLGVPCLNPGDAKKQNQQIGG